jgi:hypothetical protein
LNPAPAGSLLVYLQQIPDPRGRQGRRHSLAAMLAAVTCALLCGARGYSAISQWIHDQEPAVWHLLGFQRRPPKLGAFRKLLMKIAPEALEGVLREWAAETFGLTLGEGELQAVALDGKSLCGTFHEHGRAVHLLSLLDQQTGCVLSQQEVDGKTNEHKTALELLQGIVLQGRLVTGDSMFCQRDLSQQIIDSGGHYLWVVKDNQPTLKEAIEAEFQPAFSPCG